MNDLKFLTVEEIANILKIPETTVTRWLRNKTLKGTKLGGFWRVTESNFNEFVNNGTRE